MECALPMAHFYICLFNVPLHWQRAWAIGAMNPDRQSYDRQECRLLAISQLS
jgi:hypothetical protein